MIRGFIRSLFSPFGLSLIVFWLVLSDGAAEGALLGVLFVASALLLHSRLSKQHPEAIQLVPTRRFLPALARFSLLFIGYSIKSAVRVARAVLKPKLTVRPDYVVLETRLETLLEKHLLIYCLNLMPGTLVVRVRKQKLTLHLLDSADDPVSDFERLECVISAMFDSAQQSPRGGQLIWP